ncbi:MAG: TRAP transporter large permease subunit, partial [Burkholderiaceae bacterium]
AGALVPAALLVGLHLALVALIAIFFGRAVPALPSHALADKEDSGASGLRSLALLAGVAGLVGWGALQFYPSWLIHIGRTAPPPTDESVIVGIGAAVMASFLLSLVDHVLRLHWLSALARRVAFVLVPPLILIFLVLGTIFLGVATPTEGGAMGAVGALILALARRRVDGRQIGHTLLATIKLSTFVLFILVGSTVFSLTFQGIGGQAWVEHLFDQLPGGPIGFMVFVTALIFVLGFFLDFFEIAFILLPMLAPIADKLGIDLIWFGVLVGINLQTSFLTPPFGFALFYLRSVAPTEPTTDPVTDKTVAPVTTGDIYRGVLPFIAVQVLVMGLVIAFPHWVIPEAPKVTMDSGAIEKSLNDMEQDNVPADDPMRLLLEQMGGETPK